MFRDYYIKYILEQLEKNNHCGSSDFNVKDLQGNNAKTVGTEDMGEVMLENHKIRNQPTL